MRLSLAIAAPDVSAPLPVTLLSGSFVQRLEKAAALGYDGVEILPVRPRDLDPGAIRSMLACQGLEAAAIGTGAVYMIDGLTLLASSAEVCRQAESRLADFIDFAAAVGSPVVTIGGFRGRIEWVSGSNPLQTLIGSLKRAAETAAHLGVRLALEPLNRYETDVVHNTEDALCVCGQVRHDNLGVLLDTFHVNIEEPSVTDCFRRAMAAGRLWHVHLGDSNRLSPGRGHIDFAGIVSTLAEIGYEGYLCAELLPRPDPDVAASDTIRHMRPFVQAAGG